MPIIELDNVSKHFAVGVRKGWIRRERRQVRAVDGVSLSIEPGAMVGYIGPNGAGKSTTIKMLTGILVPSSGSVRVAGLDPNRERVAVARRIGVLFGQRTQLWWDLPLEDSFSLLRHVYRVPAERFEANLAVFRELLALDELLPIPVRQLSLGQRMRGELAAVLLHDPAILFLDEPTIGLDVTAKALLREHLKHLAEAEDTAIVLTSHDIGDIEQICARVILVNHGRILLDEPLENLRASFLREKRITIVTEDERPEPFGAAVVVERGPHRLILSIDASVCAIDEVVAEALKRLRVRDLTIENAPLEEIIRHLYGERP
jgi:ABC-2 type transport system ATP-binding protein